MRRPAFVFLAGPAVAGFASFAICFNDSDAANTAQAPTIERRDVSRLRQKKEWCPETAYNNKQ
jgi:hypothetical protein